MLGPSGSLSRCCVQQWHLLHQDTGLVGIFGRSAKFLRILTLLAWTRINSEESYNWTGIENPNGTKWKRKRKWKRIDFRLDRGCWNRMCLIVDVIESRLRLEFNKVLDKDFLLFSCHDVYLAHGCLTDQDSMSQRWQENPFCSASSKNNRPIRNVLYDQRKPLFNYCMNNETEFQWGHILKISSGICISNHGTPPFAL